MRTRPIPSAAQCQRGLTLIELLVAMAIGLVIVLAAMAALTVSRQGFTALDGASQVRDNGRFAANLLQRLAVQAGYVDSASRNPRRAWAQNIDANPPPPVTGANNALPGNWSGTEAPETFKARSRCATPNNNGCGGDVLVLSNQASADGDAKTPDNAMINCTGAATKLSGPIYSALYVDLSKKSGEPALMCMFQSDKSGWASAQPLIEGVENFQVLYGVAGVEPKTKSKATTSDPSDAIPTRFLRADQMEVDGPGGVETNNNWRRVRSVRIGLVIRGPVGSAPRGTGTLQKLYPLGSGVFASDDAQSEVMPPDDGRLRQVTTFTVQLRNYAGVQGT